MPSGEPTDPKAPSFESHMRIIKLERDQLKRTIEHLKVTMTDITSLLPELPDKDAVSELEQLLGEAGTFARNFPNIVKRVTTLAQQAPLGTVEEMTAHNAVIDDLLALVQEASELLGSVSEATQKWESAKRAKP